MKTMKLYELSAMYDGRQSFGHKAIVQTDGSTSVLYSYETPIAKIENDKVVLGPKWDYSDTTVRHVREFLRQEGKLPTSIEGAEKSTIATLFPIEEF